MNESVKAHRSVPVSLASCRSYERGAVRAAVARALDLLPGLETLLKRGSLVLLKPNLLSSRHTPDYPINTHPEVVRAVAEIVKADFGCEVCIGDSCGSMTTGSTDLAIRNTGLDVVCRETGARLFNVDREPKRSYEVPGGAILHAVQLPAALPDFDVIVSLPKLKTHGLTRYTGAVKNLFGLVPGRAKKDGHVHAPGPIVFARLLADVASVVRADLALIDGVIGMEGNGPNAGTARLVGMIGASADLVALDAIACRIIGYDPLAVPLLAECQARGLGTADPALIEVRGESAELFRLTDFRKPIGDRFGFLARRLPAQLFGRVWDALTTVWSSVNYERCRLCGECVRNCPAGAMRVEDGRVIVCPELCIACYCCDEVCPYNAIEMRGTDFARVLMACAAFVTGGRSR